MRSTPSLQKLERDQRKKKVRSIRKDCFKAFTEAEKFAQAGLDEGLVEENKKTLRAMLLRHAREKLSSALDDLDTLEEIL